ncbi:hypothetical protein N9L71_03925 [Verrucomicrobiales bacterium]|nr:hypothetical protein [Verrucomicrobiales bacterium]
MAAILRLSQQSGNAEKGCVGGAEIEKSKTICYKKTGKSNFVTVSFNGSAHFLNEFSRKK